HPVGDPFTLIKRVNPSDRRRLGALAVVFNHPGFWYQEAAEEPGPKPHVVTL
ncbi:MAG: hypothetical protein HOE14_17415, partial [Gemmatimonadales bacterium]|nr:hypothetical protein [Gemmatimonadales bacterium]